MFTHKKHSAAVQRRQGAQESLGIYIHLPFCRSKCAYCDFYSLAGQDKLMQGYQKALLAHLAETAPLAQGIAVDTIYFGGGTPSFYGQKRLRALLAAIKKLYKVDERAEITLEANPDSVDARSLRKLRRAGFNRVSIGMQSHNADELKAVGRVHTPQQTDEAVRAAKKAKFKNISLDLIYGLPEQTAESWRATVEHALSLIPQHLSCYGLKVEDNTPLARRVQQGELLPDDDMQADLYLWTVGRLERAGFGQYEISNFALDGCRSKHNLRYWLMQPYIGFGAGAHSDFGDRRYSFVRDVKGYIDGMLHGGSVIDTQELLEKRTRGGEYLMLHLRTSEGIEEWEYRSRYFMDFAPLETLLAQFEQADLTQRTDSGRWRLTAKGFLVSNQIIGALLDAQEKVNFSSLLPRAKDQYGKA